MPKVISWSFHHVTTQSDKSHSIWYQTITLKTLSHPSIYNCALSLKRQFLWDRLLTIYCTSTFGPNKWYNNPTQEIQAHIIHFHKQRNGLPVNISTSLMWIWVCDKYHLSLLYSWLQNDFGLLLVCNLWVLEICDLFGLICH